MKPTRLVLLALTLALFSSAGCHRKHCRDRDSYSPPCNDCK